MRVGGSKWVCQDGVSGNAVRPGGREQMSNQYWLEDSASLGLLPMETLLAETWMVAASAWVFSVEVNTLLGKPASHSQVTALLSSPVSS